MATRHRFAPASLLLLSAFLNSAEGQLGLAGAKAARGAPQRDGIVSTAKV